MDFNGPNMPTGRRKMLPSKSEGEESQGGKHGVSDYLIPKEDTEKAYFFQSVDAFNLLHLKKILD